MFKMIEKLLPNFKHERIIDKGFKSLKVTYRKSID